MALVTVSLCSVELLYCYACLPLLDSLYVVFEWDHTIQPVYAPNSVGFSCPLFL